MAKGRFITFEGIEGCGKSTQIRLLAEKLREAGRDIVLTREPGGTDIGEKIRAVLLDAAHRGMTPETELLLYAASRHQHVAEVIRPALESGKMVLCDRYADATTAYQGAARRIDPELVQQANRIATDGLWPDLTILFDCPADEGLTRARTRNMNDAALTHEDRFEREELSFHERVRQGYLAIAQTNPDRVVVVNASGSIEEIHAQTIEAVKRAFE